MELSQIPDLKGKKLTEKLTIPVEPELKELILSLKTKLNKDHLEACRLILRRELPKLFSR